MSETIKGKNYLSATYQLSFGNMVSAVPLLWSDGTLLSVLLDLVSANPPALPDTTGFTESQIFDTYSPYVELYGSKEAQDSLCKGEQVIVGLRMSMNTRSNGGEGDYNDRMSIIWNDCRAASTKGPKPQTGAKNVSAAGTSTKIQISVKHGADFAANTQPSAQYEDPGTEWKEVRSKKTGRVIRVKVAGKIIGPDGKEIALKKVEGDDVNGDGRRDLGQLAPGTYAFYNDGGTFLNASYLRPRGEQRVNRDVNHDGAFTPEDMWHTPDGDSVIESGNFGIYIHRGGESNTWSAGCQTLPPEQHKRFFSMLKAQKTYYYVLVTLR